ncbi:MAG TPA: hypothetical protein VKJ65_02580 [Phycisphaerae bacterium]|nr:hypothetical protein [Phycisphaerae bacterium]
MNRRVFVLFIAMLASICACLTGCESFGPLRIIPVESKQTTMLRPNFLVASFRVDQDDVFWFYFESRSPGGNSLIGIRQILILRVFWRPRPGTTTLDPSAVNATMRYIVMTPNGSGMYEGSGFVRIHGRPNSPKLGISIVDGELRLTNSSGYFQDALGPSRITGDQEALNSPDRTVALIEQSRRDFFQATYSQRMDAQNTGNPAATEQSGTN